MLWRVALGSGTANWLLKDMAGWDRLRYHTALVQQNTVSRNKQEAFKVIAVHFSLTSGGN